MLSSLEIRDMLIIDAMELDFRPGLNVLTGETGAGKSILLDALGFVLGWRGRGVPVRAGADRGEVTAVFDIAGNRDARALLAEAGLPAPDELILRRTVSAGGRPVARINDSRASVELLRQLSDSLIELHGQQDDRGLLNPAGHRRLLDEYAGAQDDLAACRTAWAARRTARAALERAEAGLAEARREEDYLRHALDELQKLDPQPGEEAGLDARRRLMQGAARIREDVARAHAALGGEGAEGRLADALRWLEGAASRAEGVLDDALAALGRALDETATAQSGIERALEAMDFDPAELERTEERLFAIRALARKHAVLPDDLAPLRDDLAARVAALDGADADLETLRRACDEAEARYRAAAGRLGARRRAAAERLEAAMERELPPLKLERARFTVEIAAAPPPGANG